MENIWPSEQEDQIEDLLAKVLTNIDTKTIAIFQEKDKSTSEDPKNERARRHTIVK